MPRYYTINLDATAFTVAADLVEITPADDKPVEIVSFRVWQTTELGDAMEEQIPVAWVRGHTVSGSGGAAFTPVPLDPDDAAAGFTCEVGNTTAANTGTTTKHLQQGWNVRGPLDRPLVPEEKIKAHQGNTTLILRMGAAPGDTTTIGCSVTVKEGV